MGGMGSGDRYWRGKKSMVEDCWEVDTTVFKRRGLLAPGTHTAGVLTRTRRRTIFEETTATIGYTVDLRNPDGVHIELRYQLTPPGESFTYPVRLVSTPCRFGGARWWFECPLVWDGQACARRARKLFLRGKYFGCRQCHNLAYFTSQKSDRRVRAFLKRGGDVDAYAKLSVGVSLSAMAFSLKLLEWRIRKLDRVRDRFDHGDET
ncbi:hypothetical protein FRUB_10112 [Fimbriiglobus ruber]|uniref:Uncharacterized protein n=2 Tax=Fimbriiglobus ruber TaxID=1908690 RepID=A0A225CXU1_9BACT|nr:hypothetical protein FRUB_10112 [Fimbriiglobus ruber]